MTTAFAGGVEFWVWCFWKIAMPPLQLRDYGSETRLVNLLQRGAIQRTSLSLSLSHHAAGFYSSSQDSQSVLC